MDPVTPRLLVSVGPLGITDTVVVTASLSAVLVAAGLVMTRTRSGREVLEVLYQLGEDALSEMVSFDVRPIVPLVLTQWVFILGANLAGLLPLVASPTRDLSLTAALAVVSLGAGHFYGFRARGWRYLRHYVEPNPLLLPFNVVGEASRTVALALRLFGNMLSAEIVGAIVLSLAGLLLPVPLMLLGVLTSVVQAYIFGVLTLVFTASAVQVAARHAGPEHAPAQPEVRP